MGDEGQIRPHAIMISVPFQGHITPFLSLALKLAAKGFAVTFVHLEFLHHKLSQARHGNTPDGFFSEARKSGLDIRYATIGDGLGLEFDRDGRLEEYWEAIVRDFGGRVDGFVGEMVEADPEGVYFLVADTVYPWPAAVAEKYQLVNVSFWTQPALVFSLAYHWDLLQEKGHFPVKANMDEEVNYVPGVESISTKDLMAYFKESDAAGIVSRSTRLSFDGAKSADFILHNTLHELEPHALSALSKYTPNYAIGPISFSQNLPTSSVGKSFWSESDCTAWLRSKPPASVLYVSFGSLVKTSKRIIEEIAHGLLLSEVDFVWVIRQGILGDGDDDDVLPRGFEEMVGDKGLVVPWCDQVRVLSSPAVGGFLTHCGWNSTLESMWCGVPMMCYPIGFEQFCNRKLVVDDWKIGVNLCDGVVVEREEVAEKIKWFMGGDVSGSFRKEADKVREILRSAVESGGSSERNFDRFVEDLEKKLCRNTKEVE